MRPRNLVFITVLALCHPEVRAQALTNALPPAPPQQTTAAAADDAQVPNPTPIPVSSSDLPDDPDQQLLPTAKPEPAPDTGVKTEWSADTQNWVGNTWTGTGHVEFHYRGYILRADKVVYNHGTTELDAEGNVQVTGGPNDVLINADHGDMLLNLHTGRFYQVHGSQGVRSNGHSVVYSTANPFLFSGRVLIQLGEGNYRIVDGTMTNCRLPKPDWQLISRNISLVNGEASTRNATFKFLGIPLFFLPYLRHPVDDTGRESGILIPVLSNSSIKGFVVGEQIYWVINRSMDMVAGAEYYSKRGWAPNGDFRYKGPEFDHLTVRWNALLDRGVEQQVGTTLPPTPSETAGKLRASGGPRPGDLIPGPIGMELVNQGGVDVAALGRKDITPETRVAGIVEFLSSYVYRLVFNDNYSQAISSEVASDLSATHAHRGFIPSVSLDRFQTFASSTNGDEARILHIPNLRYDVLDQPLGTSRAYWGLGSSLDYLSRSEPGFHARNVGRFDFFPHFSLPFHVDGWSLDPELAFRDTFYTGSQNPDLTDARGGTPTISHDSLNRADLEARLDIRPPAVERDFALTRWNRELRHVIEPEFTYRFVGGIGARERSVLLVDTDDIATDTNEAEVSVTQRIYVRQSGGQPCANSGTSVEQDQATESDTDKGPSSTCPAKPREWASWQVAQKFYFDPNFGGALIPNRRNVFETTLDLTGVAFLTAPRNLTPIVSRMRFEAVPNLRLEWDLDFDPKTGRLASDNVLAGYSWGDTTVGVGHAMLNAVDENNGSASTIQSQQLQPFLYIGKQNRVGFNLAANAGYDFVQQSLQYAGVQAVYNWNCCGLTFGYRRFELGSIRDETQYLYSFTLANFGSVGDIRRSNSVFRDPSLPPAY